MDVLYSWTEFVVAVIGRLDIVEGGIGIYH